MITLKIFGSTPPCAKCKELEKRARKVGEKFPGKVKVAKFDAASPEGSKYGIMFIPAVVINDKVVSSGKVLSEGELEKAIKETEGK